MNCKICGAELSKPGELCNNCMNKLLKEQELKNDNSVVAVVKGTYVAKYEIVRHFQEIGIALFMVILLFTLKAWVWALVALGLFTVIGLISLFRIRAKINSKSCTIYKTKVVINWGILRKKSKEIPFDQIADMYPHVTSFQEFMHIGTFVIRKNTLNLVDRFEYIDSVKNIEDVYEKIRVGLGMANDTPTQE